MTSDGSEAVLKTPLMFRSAEPRGTPINLWDDPDESDGWTGHDPGSVQVAEQGYEPESAGEFDYLTSV